MSDYTAISDVSETLMIDLLGENASAATHEFQQTKKLLTPGDFRGIVDESNSCTQI